MGEEETRADISLVILKVKSISDDIDKKVSKSESNCIICGIPFSKKGTSQTSKHVCRFCYHACCAACSPLTAIHPESNESERICLKCYTSHLKASVDEENEKKNQEIIRDQIQAIQRETIELHGKELEKIKEDSRNQERHYKDQISKLNNEIQERESRIMSMSFEENRKLSEKDQSISKFIKDMKDIEEKGKEIEKNNKTIENQNFSLEDELKNLQTQLKSLETFNTNLGKENKILQDKIKNMQNELENKGKIYTPEPKSGCMNSCVIY
ncbi:hypothetical protein SteCoe_30898 [Stentor coeruleus]|uniref:FYVE-type domain-containing protein n=1 Tax=Stentor coeruleus TaxID=5963 RepID=A0A1R2B2M7_9CILI|nr:hypothetical protein SteCoe_30898 [Stentor coeruleus]